MVSSVGQWRSGVLNSEVHLEYIYIHTYMHTVNTVDFASL